ncbi:DMT family transporter [Cohnella sp. 56]|uniref:DMT family transporter n=1 Tax=Cohnella sp. 56 TaxID=3113722 RepID=UPI0030E9535E
MRRTLLALLLLLSLIWGGSYYFIKVLLEAFEPWTIVFLRSALGLAVIAAHMAWAGKPFGFRGMPWGAAAVMALVNTCLPWAIIGLSETRIASGMASVLNATTPLWTLALGIVFFGAAARRAHWIGMSVAVAGLVVLLGPGLTSGGRIDSRGAAGMLAASFLYGLGSQLSKILLQKITPYQATFCTLLFSMLGSGVMALATERVSVRELAVPHHLSVLVGLGVFGSGVAYILFYRIVQEGGPEFATMVTYLLPAFSLLWGFSLLGESVRLHMAAGLALILAGVFVSSRNAARERAAESARAMSA